MKPPLEPSLKASSCWLKNKLEHECQSPVLAKSENLPISMGSMCQNRDSDFSPNKARENDPAKACPIPPVRQMFLWWALPTGQLRTKQPNTDPERSNQRPRGCLSKFGTSRQEAAGFLLVSFGTIQTGILRNPHVA